MMVSNPFMGHEPVWITHAYLLCKELEKFMNIYPARIRKMDPWHYKVVLRDCPDYADFANTADEAAAKARKWLLEHLQLRANSGLSMPMPTPPMRGDTPINIGPSNGVKVFLHNYLIVNNISRSELARRLKVTPQAVGQVLKFGHDTQLSTLVNYTEALCLRMNVDLIPIDEVYNESKRNAVTD